MKLYMFRTVPLCPSSGVYSLYTERWYMSYWNFTDGLVQTALGGRFYCFLALGVFSIYFDGYVFGCKLFSLHILIYHIAALVFYSFSLVFLYWYVSFACLALTNFTFVWPCIVTNSWNFSMTYTSVFQTFFKWGPLSLVRMFYWPPNSWDYQTH